MIEQKTKAKLFPTKTFQDPHVSIVISVYQNRETLHELYHRLRQVFQSQELSYEIIFVDDASPDGSLAILEELARGDSQVGVLVLERNVGQQQAVLVGLRYASGKCVVVMDADLQDPPEAIPDLLDKLQEGPAAVFAGKRGQYESAFRLFTSRLFRKLRHLLCGVPEDAGIFVAINTQMVKHLLAFNTHHPFIVAMIGCTKLSLVSIPVVRAQRPSGISAYNFWGRLKTGLLTIAWVISWRWFPRFRTSRRCEEIPSVKAYIRTDPTSINENLR
ncbi:glycosyltransferase family 2 protein [Candidatus Pacearchaeota archaeon]|nr:glycosyltransferase family 2 protein [Candidatus Pacearchaeota archaeon]